MYVCDCQRVKCFVIMFFHHLQHHVHSLHLPPPLPLPSPLLQVCPGNLVTAGATGSLPPGALSSAHILKHPPTLRKIAQVVDVVAKDGSSPLILAAMGGHIEVVAYLLSIGASINHRNKAGWTALIAAAAKGQVFATSTTSPLF